MTPAFPSLPVLMLALLATHLAGMGAFLTVPVLAPAIAAETGLPASLAGAHTALVYAGSLLTAPLTGPLVQRLGAVRVLQAGLLVVGLGLALGMVGQAWALALSALVAGMGHGPVTPCGSHLIAARTPPRRRALAFSMKQAGVPAGAMLVAAMAPAIAVLAGWRAGLLAMALTALLVALVLQPLRAPLDAGRDRRAGAGWRVLARGAGGSLGMLRSSRALLHLTVMSCGYGVAQFCFLTFFVTYLVGTHGIGMKQAGLTLALAQAGGVVGRIAWALVADRIGARPVLLACGVLAAAAALVLAAAGVGTPLMLVALAGVVMGVTAVGWNGVMLAEAARIAPEGQVGAATSALSFAFGVTMLVAPPAFAFLVEASGGYAAGFALCALCALGGALAIATGPRK